MFLFFPRNLNLVSDIYHYIVAKLGSVAWSGSDRKQEERIIDMYHKSIDVETQKKIIFNFPKSDSVVRCLIATVAFGMGIEVENLGLVIHWGVSKSVLSYWQEVGRCGRDGARAEAFMYATKRSINKKSVSEDMLTFCDVLQHGNECIRHTLLRYLVVDGMDSSALDELTSRTCTSTIVEGECNCKFNGCCSNCAHKCKMSQK